MSSSGDSPLSEAEWADLEARADRFHAALAAGQGSVWEPFLENLHPRMRVAVLGEMAVLDLSHQWKNGRRPTVEEYLKRFPELGTLASIPLKIIVEEYICRRRTGEVVTEEDVRTRFPSRFASIWAELEKGKLTQIGSVRPTSGSGPVRGTERNPSELSMSQQYDMIRELGRGMFGEVWLAKKMPSGIEKAVKIITAPADRQEAQRELQTLELIKNLRHPYLLATEDFWIQNNRLYIVMELAEGTLRSTLKKYREKGQVGIPPTELIGYIREAAEGLDFLHENNVIHRDVKPDNILLMKRHAKLADFGLARQQERVLASMSFAGTPAYMAPEIWGGEGGQGSDQYSLAFVYVELRQGSPPLKPQNMAEMMFAHLDGNFDFHSIVTEAEQKVLRKAMSKNPADRYPNCTAFAEDLAEALGFQVMSRTPPGGSSTAFNSLRTIEKEQTRESEDVSIHVGSGASWKPPVSKAVESRPSQKSNASPSGTFSPLQSVATKPRPGTTKPLNLKPIMAVVLLLALVGIIGGIVYASLHGSGQTATTEPTPTNSGSTTSSPQSNPITHSIPSTPATTPNPDAVWLPPRAIMAENAKIIELADRRKLYDWVILPTAEVPVRFRLITSSAGSPVTSPFYMMESKVWVNLYMKAANERKLPEELTSREGRSPDEPALGMTAVEAQNLAREAFGGSLPTPEEWDHAAGYYDQRGRVGPALAQATFHIDKSTPGPTFGVGVSTDLTPLGLRDLCGNGREFTQRLLKAEGQPGGLLGEGQPPEPMDFVVLRGRNYTLAKPLDFAILKTEQTQPQTQFVSARSRFTGFRVVIRVP